MTTSTPTLTPLRILTFGDSLTEGYSQYGLVFTPYSDFLLSHLHSQIGHEYDISIRTEGVSGQLITAGFQSRMSRIYLDKSTKEEPFDWIIFLGGTNDIGYGLSPQSIYDSLEDCTAIPLSFPSPPQILILTVPECGVKNQNLDRRRNAFNALIRSDARERVWVLDLWEKVKYHEMPEEDRDEIWDDGLHFTPMGYERIGMLVGAKLVGILSGEAGGDEEARREGGRAEAKRQKEEDAKANVDEDGRPKTPPVKKRQLSEKYVLDSDDEDDEIPLKPKKKDYPKKLEIEET